MATIFKSDQREFQESPNKVNPYRIFTDISRVKKGIIPENLNFDIRQLNPDQFSAPYHYHRYAEELFFVISGSVTLRTPEGLEIVNEGDVIFFEKGDTGAHQLYNHTASPCVYLDIRTFVGFDVAEYPDSEKMLMAPSLEIYNKDSKVNYFEGETEIIERWKKLPRKAE